MKDPAKLAKAKELRQLAEEQLRCALVSEEIGEKGAALVNLEAAIRTEQAAVEMAQAA